MIDIELPEAPLSETAIPKLKSGTAEQCVNDLRGMAEREPERAISRNFYRVNGQFADSVWNGHFGTFEEFKRQAGLVLTRQQHAMERHVAKHVSVDHYRRMNIERADYGTAYNRPSSARFKTRVFCSDLHDKEMDPFYRRVLVDSIRRIQPDSFSIVGDALDLPEFGKYGVDPREWDVVGRIHHYHGFLQEVRDVYDGQIDHQEGNHEFRLLRHLADQSPALMVVLGDLHGMTVRQLFGLDRFEVNYIAKADLTAFRDRDLNKEIGKNYTIYDECFLAHHFPQGRDFNMPGVNGHHHKHQVWPHFNPMYGAFEWHQMGCGHVRNASYTAGEKWHMGFAIAHIDTQTRQVNTEYVQVTDYAVVGGKWYHREPQENHVRGDRLTGGVVLR